MQSRPITFDRVVRILTTIIVLTVIVLLINYLRDVLLPFVVACLIAYMLEPIVEWQQRWMHLRSRALPVIVTLLEVSVVLAGVGYFIIPSIIDEVHQLDALVNRSDGHPGFLPPEIEEYIQRTFSIKNITDLFTGTRWEQLLNKSTTVLATAVDFLMHTLEWLLTVIYVLFIMLDYKQLMNGFREMVPPKYRKIAYRLSDDIKDSMNRYFRSQAVIALCAAVLYAIGFSIIGLPLAIVMGFIVGILYMIPYFQYITIIPVAVLCYVASLTGDHAFWTMMWQSGLVYLISQSICDYVLTPKIMGKSLGLNPAIILLALSVWGSLMGIIGMIIALPMTALIISYYNEYVLRGKPSADIAPVDGTAHHKGE